MCKSSGGLQTKPCGCTPASKENAYDSSHLSSLYRFFLLELQGISVRMQQCARAQVVCKLNPVDALRLIKGTSITPSI